jgi:hypothetical protein
VLPWLLLVPLPLLNRSTGYRDIPHLEPTLRLIFCILPNHQVLELAATGTLLGPPNLPIPERLFAAFAADPTTHD